MIWKGKVNILYQGILNKIIGEINLSVIIALVDDKSQYESDCSPRYNRVIFFKVVYSLHLSISPCTEPDLEIPKYTIRKVIEIESSGAWNNVSTSH